MEKALTSVQNYSSRIDEVVRSKQLHRWSSTPEFDQILKGLAASLDGSDDLTYTLAVATMSKVALLVRPQRERISIVLKGGLKKPINLQALEDSDDRYYGASFWRFAQPNWTSEVLALTVMEEETAETVRKECVEGLFASEPNLVSIIRALTAHVGYEPKGKKPSEAKAKRIRRVVLALREVLSNQLIAIGQDLGNAFARMIRDSFEGLGSPGSGEVALDLADECLAFIHEAVRSDYSIATYPATYASLTFIRSWFGDTGWETLIERSSYHKVMARDLEAALEIMVRAGRADTALYQHFETLNDKKSARFKAEAIADRNPGLDYDLVEWLHGRVPRKSSELATENQFLKVDEQIADLLLSANSMLELSEDVRRDLIPRVRTFDSRSAEPIESYADRVHTLVQSLLALAADRRMSIRGTAGDVVEYSPLEHQLADASNFGARNVRIVRPSVVATSEAGGTKVVRKALVESI